MFNTTQSTSVSIETPIPHHVFCHKCKLEMIAVNKHLNTPSYVCYECGITLVIETKEETYKLTEYAKQGYRVATKIIWGKIPVTTSPRHYEGYEPELPPEWRPKDENNMI